MPWHPAQLWRRFLANPSALLIVMLGMGVGGIATILFHAAAQENQTYRQQLQQQLNAGMQEQRQSLSRVLTDYGVWDESARRVNRARPDLAWLHNTLTQSLYLNMQIDRALIVDSARQRILYAVRDGQPQPTDDSGLTLSDTDWQWLAAVSARQARRPATRYLESRENEQGQAVRHFYLVAAQPILREHGATPPGHHKLMLFARRIDHPLVRDPAANATLPPPQVSARPSQRRDQLSLPIPGQDGRALAWLTWPLHPPGDNLLRQLAPATLALCLTLLLLGLSLGQLANRLRQRQSATLTRLARQGAALREIVERSGVPHGQPIALCRTLAQTLAVRRVVIWQQDLATRQWHSVAGIDRHNGQAIHATKLTPDPGHLAQLEHQHFLALAQVDPRWQAGFQQYVQQHRLGSLLLTSIRVGQKMHGFISAEHLHPHRWHQDEINFLCAAANAIALQTESGARQAAEHELTQLFYFDPVTGLPNAHRLHQWLDSLTLTQRVHPGACCVVELRDLPHLIEGYDQTAGEALLHTVAQRLSELIRGSEIVARLNERHFALWLEGTSEAELTQRLDQLHQRMNAPCLLDGLALHPRFQIGVSLFPGDGHDADSLIEQAQAALQHGQPPGKSSWVRFNSQLSDARRSNQQLRLDLRQALQRQELSLHFQPLINLHTGEISGAEALLRWTHAERGAISPALFIPLAEEDDVLICAIGKWVLEQACAQAANWRRRFQPQLRLSVNVSVKQLEAPGFHQLVHSALASHALPASALELELTESIALSNAPALESNLRGLQAQQIEMAIDDFGTGYASFSYLRRFPVSRLKVDRQFFEQVPEDEQKSNLVKMIVAMGHAMGAEVIGEGVEDAQQVQFLRRIGGDYAQGYYFSRPLPPAEMEALLAQGLPPLP